jgi:hypothetical protein
MARSRNIKPGFFTNDALAELPPLVRLFFIGLWTLVDRDGRAEDRPKKLKAECMPYDDLDAEAAVSSLEASGFLVRYVSSGIKCIQVVNWHKHQNPHNKEQASSLPAPDMPEACTGHAPDMPETSPEVAVLIPDSGFPSSVAKATDGPDGPAPVGNSKAKSPEDMAKAELWQAAVSVLEAGGCPKSQARTFMGKLVQDYSLEAVKQAVSAAVSAQPADAREYLKATCQRLKGERKDPVTVPSDAAEKTAALLAEQAARVADAPTQSIREKLNNAKAAAALAGLALKVAA